MCCRPTNKVPALTGPLVLSTLADYAGRYQLVANCMACDRHVVLDMDALMARYGPDTTVDDVRPRLACRVCGEKPHRVTVAHEDSPGYR